jgi:FkbM family methyltransferase
VEAYRPEIAAVGEVPAGFDPAGALDIQTEIGPLWLQRDDDAITPVIVDHKRWEPALSNLLRRVLRPGGSFVDVGANIGYFSVLASDLVGPGGRVFAVEPDSRNRAFLEANLARNRCANVTILPYAAWSEDSSLTLETHPAGGSMSSVHPIEAGDGESAETVPAKRLDELIEGPVDLLKIDCELVDHIALAGAAGLLRADPSTLATVELARNHVGPTGHTPTEILSQYEGLGLRPYRIRSTGSLKPIPYSSLLMSRKGTDVAHGSMGGPGEDDTINFALSAGAPEHLIVGFEAKEDIISYDRRVALVDSALRFGGNLLEHVPERIRPRIRRRDRLARLRAEGDGERP